jgi:hypothetical protein
MVNGLGSPIYKYGATENLYPTQDLLPPRAGL